MNDVIRYTIARAERGWRVQDGVNLPVVVDSIALATWLEDQLARAEYLVVAVAERSEHLVSAK